MTSLFIQFQELFAAVSISLLLALLFAPLIIGFAKRINLLDMPNRSAHNQHTRPIPLTGGMIVFAVLISASFLFSFGDDKNIVGMLIAGLVVLGFGLWDDFRGLSTGPKLTGQILAALLLIKLDIYIRVFEGSSISFLSKEIGLLLNWVVTVFWVIAVTNAFNLIDSMDGIVSSISSITFATFVFISITSGQRELSVFSATMLGICIGVFFYNSFPAQLFLGDSGSQFLGFLLASTAIIFNPRGFSQAGSWFLPILLLGLPLFDTALVVYSRYYHQRPLFQGDLGHTFHRLVNMGLGKNRAVILMQTITLLLSFASVFLLSVPTLLANIIFGAIIVAGSSLVIILGRREIPKKLP